MSIDQESLADAIVEWEPPESEVVRTIDSVDGTVERIIKIGDKYWLHRYFMLREESYDRYLAVSADLNGVDADRVIQNLAERL